MGYAEGLIQTYAQGQRTGAQMQRAGNVIKAPVEAQVRVWYNTDLVSRNFIVPGLIAVILMIIAAMLTSLTVAREWENGTMEQLLSTPVRPVEIALGKLSAYFVLGIVDMLISLFVGDRGFQRADEGESGCCCLFRAAYFCLARWHGASLSPPLTASSLLRIS